VNQKEYYQQYQYWYAPTTMDSRFPVINADDPRNLGTEVWDINGKRYLDFFAQVGVVNVGHNHPAVVEAIKRQTDKLIFIASQDLGYYSDDVSPIHLAQALQETIPFPVKFIPEVSGATTVNAAVKFLCRTRSDRRIFLSFLNDFHGRHGYALDLTFSKAVQKKDFPSTLDTYHPPFPIDSRSVREFKDLLYRLGPDRINALFFEPIQGEGGGMKAAEKKALNEIASLCQENGILLVSDEIQSGFGRTGKWWAFEHYDFQPDLICMAKAIGAGLPIGMVAYKREIEKSLEQAWHSSTYAGGPIPVAAALAVLKVIKEENLVAQAAQKGNYLSIELKKIARLAERKAHLKIKGLGLMQGVEFQTASKFYPYPELKEKVLEKSLAGGLLLLPSGDSHFNPTLRFELPLNISQEHLDEGLNIFKNALLKSL